MKHKDWQYIEELFHTALGVSAEDRDRYLAQACSDDASLRAEVETLLVAFKAQSKLMERPVFSVGMRLLSEDSDEEILVGKRIGSYQVLEMIGKGGMGQVYLAEDTNLDRKVALKFLSNSLVDDTWAKKQLRKEAQAVAKLDHPNICTVYGFEEVDDYNFMVMQYIEGETLASLIQKRLLEPEHIFRLATQIVSALTEAQSHDIIHRDIKPQNIMVTANGQVKVLDFGLAKFVQQRQGALNTRESEGQSSELGLVLGTVAYMSPEQLRAERLDFRSDIFSFGIVLYEMSSGRNPFSYGSQAEIISAILTSEPEPLKNLPAGLPAGLTDIAQKCLKKDKEQRYQSASELLLDLDNAPTKRTIRSHWQTYFNWRTYALFALLMLFFIGGAFAYFYEAKVRTLAILPIVNESSEDKIELSQGLTESLVRKLSHLSKLRVKSPTVVSQNKDERFDPQTVGLELKVEEILEGTITQQGESLILQLKLIKVADGTQIWGDTYHLEPETMLRLVDELPIKIASELQLSLSEDERKALTVRLTENPNAYKNYSKGRHFWNKRGKKNIKEAINHFEKALDDDPDYALAYSGLADCYLVLSSPAYGSLPTKEAMLRAKAAANRALEIDPTLCEAHTSLGIYQLRYEWNWQEAEREFKRALYLNSNYVPAHFWYATLLALTGRLSESITESQIAKELDPLSPMSHLNLGRAYYYARQYKEVANYFLNVLEIEPDNQNALYMLGCLHQQQGRYQESIDALEKVYAVDPDLAAAPLGYTYAKAGRKTDARRILEKLEEASKQKYVPAQEKALIYLGLDDKNQAFKLLDEACTERFASLPMLLIDPLVDDIRSDPRFIELKRRANLLQ